MGKENKYERKLHHLTIVNIRSVLKMRKQLDFFKEYEIYCSATLPSSMHKVSSAYAHLGHQTGMGYIQAQWNRDKEADELINTKRLTWRDSHLLAKEADKLIDTIRERLRSMDTQEVLKNLRRWQPSSQDFRWFGGWYEGQSRPGKVEVSVTAHIYLGSNFQNRYVYQRTTNQQAKFFMIHGKIYPSNILVSDPAALKLDPSFSFIDLARGNYNYSQWAYRRSYGFPPNNAGCGAHYDDRGPNGVHGGQYSSRVPHPDQGFRGQYDNLNSSINHVQANQSTRLQDARIDDKTFNRAEPMTVEELGNLSVKSAGKYKTKRVKFNQFSYHPITIMVNDIQKDAFIIKKTGYGGRHRRIDRFGKPIKDAALGAGSYKFVQEALLMYEGKDGKFVHKKFALTAEDLTAEDKTPSKRVQDFKRVQDLMTKFPDLRRVCAEVKYLPSVRTHNHGSNRVGQASGPKRSRSIEKTLGMAVLSEDANAFFSTNRSKEEKNMFINGVLELIQTLAKKDLVHNDIKPANLDKYGRAIDNDSMTARGDGLEHLYTSIYGGFWEGSNFDDKKKQDAFAAAASIYFILTGKHLVDRFDLVMKRDSHQIWSVDTSQEVLFKIHRRIDSLHVKENLKELLWNMTGTNNKGPYQDCENLYGTDLLNWLQQNFHMLRL